MLLIDNSTRITQSMSNRKENIYYLYNSKSGIKLDLNSSAYNLILLINKGKLNDKGVLKNLLTLYYSIFKFDVHDYISFLKEHKIAYTSNSYKKNENIFRSCQCKFPLTYLSLELISCCNLSCIHCYGNFGHTSQQTYITLDYIKSLKYDLNRLDTKSIALTGGEVFLHDEIEEIALFFLENGFELTIFTNGTLHEKIKRFLKVTKNYYMTIMVSLDGLEKTHNLIRGNKNAYKNTIETLNLLSKYDNINKNIATTIMKENISEVNMINEFVKNKYPKFNHMFDIIIPTGDIIQNKSAFGVEEFDKYLKDSSILGFDKIKTQDYKNNQFRCSGGVSSGFINSNKQLQICAAANADPFIIGDLKNKSLYDLWLNPEGNGNKFRGYNSNELEKCSICKNRNECNIINCRVASYAYVEDYRQPNPVICHFIKDDKNEHIF